MRACACIRAAKVNGLVNVNQAGLGVILLRRIGRCSQWQHLVSDLVRSAARRQGKRLFTVQRYGPYVVVVGEEHIAPLDIPSLDDSRWFNGTVRHWAGARRVVIGVEVGW